MNKMQMIYNTERKLYNRKTYTKAMYRYIKVPAYNTNNNNKYMIITIVF